MTETLGLLQEWQQGICKLKINGFLGLRVQSTKFFYGCAEVALHKALLKSALEPQASIYTPVSAPEMPQLLRLRSWLPACAGEHFRLRRPWGATKTIRRASKDFVRLHNLVL